MFDGELDEAVAGMKIVIQATITATEHLANSEDGDRMAAATAKLGKKMYQAFRDEGFTAEQAIELTAAGLKKG